MSDYDIQMKKSTNGVWDNLYPINRTINVYDARRSMYLDAVLDNLYSSVLENKTYIDKEIVDVKELIDTNKDGTDNQITTLEKNINLELTKIKNVLPTINVRDFGAVGDGITDDTVSIQNAIDSLTMQRQTILFPATNGGHYSVTSLTLKQAVTTYKGEGDARIYFTDSIGLHVKEEYQIFDNLTIWHKGDSHSNVRIFNDERTNFNLDFDIKLKDCYFGYADKVVCTWGRGVNFDNCSFNDITGQFIYLTVKAETDLKFGQHDIQKYKTGYRGYTVNNSRFHYCNNAWIMETVNDFSKVVQGVTILNNQIEGGIGYFKGFVRNLLFKNNNHYQADSRKEALFEFDGFQDVTIDVKINGMQSNLDGYSKRINRLVQSLKGGDNLKITGSLRGVKKHVITLYEGTSNLFIDLIVTDVVGENSYVPSLLHVVGSSTYDCINVKGSFFSNNSNTIVIDSDGKHKIYNYNDDGLFVRGNYGSKSNVVKS